MKMYMDGMNGIVEFPEGIDVRLTQQGTNNKSLITKQWYEADITERLEQLGGQTENMIASPYSSLTVLNDPYKLLQLVSTGSGETLAFYDTGFGIAEIATAKNITYRGNQHRFQLRYQENPVEAMTIWGDIQQNQMIPVIEFPIGVSVLIKSAGNDMFSAINKTTLDARADTIKDAYELFVNNRFNAHFAQGIYNRHPSNPVQAAIFCAGQNSIDIYSDSKYLGKIYRPAGQTPDNLVIEANNQLQLISAQTATSIYCKKALTTGNLDQNWRGLVVNSTDNVDANLI